MTKAWTAKHRARVRQPTDAMTAIVLVFRVCEHSEAMSMVGGQHTRLMHEQTQGVGVMLPVSEMEGVSDGTVLVALQVRVDDTVALMDGEREMVLLKEGDLRPEHAHVHNGVTTSHVNINTSTHLCTGTFINQFVRQSHCRTPIPISQRHHTASSVLERSLGNGEPKGVVSCGN